MRFRNSIEIKTPNDFECVADDILTDFLNTFIEHEGLTREVTEEDEEAFGGKDVVGWMYTQKGMKLYCRAVERLKKLGKKIFQDEDLTIESSGMLFP